MTGAGREALVRWQSAVWAFRTAVVQRVYDEHPADRRVLVRYEDLVADPARELVPRQVTFALSTASQGRRSQGRRRKAQP